MVKKSTYGAPEAIGKTEPASGLGAQSGRQGRQFSQTEPLNSWSNNGEVELVGHTIPVTTPLKEFTDVGGKTMPVSPVDQAKVVGTGPEPYGNTIPASFPDLVNRSGGNSGLVDLGKVKSRRPVMGWLVCIKGPDCGSSFEIYSEYNYVGRERGDIIIPNDKSISGSNHMRVSYEPRQRVFSVSLCEGHNHVYLNGEGLEGFSRLKDYDIIETGSTFLLFKSLCNENFSWDQVDNILEKYEF